MACGVLDGEGCITCGHKGKYLQLKVDIVNTNKDLLKKAQVILDSLEIDSDFSLHSRTKPPRKPAFGLVIRGKHNLEKFFAKVPIQSKDKIARWNELKMVDISQPTINTITRRRRFLRNGNLLLEVSHG